MSISNVKLILMRELRDQLRDRRTLFTIAVLPLLLYPLLGMAFLQVAQFTQQHPTKIWVIGANELAEDPVLIRDGAFPPELCLSLDVSDLLQLELEEDRQRLGEDDDPDTAAREAVQDGEFDAVIYFPPDFREQLEQFRDRLPDRATPVGDVLNKAVIKVPSPRIYYDTARDESRIAHDRVSSVLQNWREEIGRMNLEKSQMPLAVARPFELLRNDVAVEEQRRAAIWSKILPFIVFIWALTGAFHPAIDLCAGEKERGTLETLLCSPAGRTEIVLGKLLTVLIFSVATSLLNLASMGFTGTFILGRLQAFEGNMLGVHLGPPPLVATGWLILALIPLAALFSALSLAIAALARSAKEGQYYLMPLLLIMMPLMMLPMLPAVRLDLGTALIPVTGMMLLLQSLMEAEYAEALNYALPVIGVTVLCCLLAVRWAVDQFNNESVLFRESERLDLGLWLRHLVRDREDTPTVGEALLCGVALLVIRFFANFLGVPEDWNDLFVLTCVTQIAFIATPALLMAIMLTRRPGKTLLLRMPRLTAIPAAILLAICLHPAAMLLAQFVQHLYPLDEGVQQVLADLFGQAPNIWVVLLMVAVLPAICEELAFRGFILSGLRHMGHKWRAIVFSSLFFGVMHGILQQSVAATVVGCVIGYLAVQTGSILPCIAYHLTHNSLAVLASQMAPESVQGIPANEWMIRFAEDGFSYQWPVTLTGTTIALMLLYWFRNLPYQMSNEEELQQTLDHQTISESRAMG